MLFISIVAVLVVIATILIRKSKKEDIITHYETSHIEELAPETTPTIVPVVEEVVEVKKPEAKKSQNKKHQAKSNAKKPNKK
jgi:hypothetical protein